MLIFGAAVAGVAATISAIIAERQVSQGSGSSNSADNVHGSAHESSGQQYLAYGRLFELFAWINACLRGRRRVAGAILVATTGVVMVSTTSLISMQASGSASSPPINIAVDTTTTDNPPQLAGERVAVGTRTTLYATPENPAGCSSTYRIHGEVLDPPPPDAVLWVMLLSGEGDGGGTFFTGRRIGDEPGPYNIRIAVDTSSGQHMYTFMLISVGGAGDVDLQSASRMDANSSTIVRDLPFGSNRIVETTRHRQLC